jgi:hypothetical protein
MRLWGPKIKSMPDPSPRIPQKLRLMAGIAIAVGLGLCALALVAQAMHRDEIGLLALPLFFA